MRRFLIALAVLPWLVACGSERPSSVASAQPTAEEPPGSVPVDDEETGGPVAAGDVQGDEGAIEACQAIDNYAGASLAAAYTSDVGTLRHWDGPGPGKMPEGRAYSLPGVIKGKPDDMVAYACFILDEVVMPGPPGTPELMGVIVIADSAGGSSTWLGIVKDQLIIERPTYDYELPRGGS